MEGDHISTRTKTSVLRNSTLCHRGYHWIHCLSITRPGCLRTSSGYTKTGVEDGFPGRKDISILLFRLHFTCGPVDWTLDQ